MKYEYIASHEGILKEYLLEIGLSKKFCRRVKLYGKMYINNEEVKNYYNIKIGDKITLELNELPNEDIKAVNIPIDIVYEDDHLLVIDKPVSLSSQPSRLHFEDNVVSYVKNYFQNQNIVTNVHIVTRLDYQTSGLMVIAKDSYTHYKLTNESKIVKKYLALTKGIFDVKEDIINNPIARKSPESILREVNDNGKIAITKYRVINEFSNQTSLVDVEIFTGRTHQIRVHLAYIGHPIIGDKLYFTESDRLYLHCYYLKFLNPSSGKIIQIISQKSFENQIK